MTLRDAKILTAPLGFTLTKRGELITRTTWPTHWPQHARNTRAPTNIDWSVKE
jgi:hypothetical protein